MQNGKRGRGGVTTCPTNLIWMFPQGDSICKVFWFSRLIFDYFCGVDPLTAICGSPPGENRAIELRELGQSGDLLLVLLEGESL